MSRRATDREQVVARLRELEELGEQGLPRRSPAARASASASRAPVAAGASAPAPAAPLPISAPVSISGAAQGPWEDLPLDELRGFLADCQRCKLCAGRTQVVFGTGHPDARLMFVGEGPGREEDLRGEPFVGRAGMLLTDMIQKGMGLRREDVYIANVVKCRPPGNRNPEPDEIAACSPFLRRQVALIRPEVIVGLGKFAVQTLLQTQEAIGRLRGRWHEFEGIPLMPTFHPAYLLRNPAEKRTAWEDLQQVMKRLGLAPP